MTDRTCTFYDGRRRLRCTECGRTVDLCQCVEVDEIASRRIASRIGRFLNDAFNVDGALIPHKHLAETILANYGAILTKIVQHDTDRSIAESEIYRDLVFLTSLLATLATSGTPEYAYPTDDTE